MTSQMHDEFDRPAESNGLGLAGFIVSLVGLVGTCGLLSPIGLVLSLIGLGKQPRGFAIAGAVIGAVGSLWVAGLVILVGAVGFAVALAAIAGAAFVVGSVLGSDVGTVVGEIKEHYDANGRVPYVLTELTDLAPPALNDEWGRPLIYEPDADGMGFTLRSAGEDGAEDTGDDWRIYYNLQSDEFRLKSEDSDINWN